VKGGNLALNKFGAYLEIIEFEKTMELYVYLLCHFAKYPRKLAKCTYFSRREGVSNA
jgi:hypothetical protein